MPQPLTPDLCVIGAGPGGLAAAAKAASYGASIVLIERGAMGGQSLTHGALPLSALCAAARRFNDLKNAWRFGVKAADFSVNHREVGEFIESVIAEAAPNVSAERYTGLGADIIKAPAKFLGPDTVAAGNFEVKARRFIIATGSGPLIPPIPGLDRVPYFTDETIFLHKHRIPHLLIAGAGPTALEFAQAYRRLGSDVTVIAAGPVLPRDDPELRNYLLKCLKEEGVRIVENARIERIEPFGSNIQAVFAVLGRSYSLEGSHLLLTLGRAPNVASLNLEAAGIKYSAQGIAVTAGMKTSNKKVYAIGDVTGATELAHAATHHAHVALMNALFRLPLRASNETLPWITFTEPEVAHVGMTEEAARAAHGRLTILRWPYRENERAQAERQTGGFVKVVASRRGKVLGAGIAGAQAGELIQAWSLAMQKNIPLGAMAGVVAPYPTLSEMNKMASESYFLPRAQSTLARRIIGLLAKFG
jgi:pyruvate/2-oxoglutarate dehydrogenase complex dihydrolipoamide dehydrogenase (E3) component